MKKIFLRTLAIILTTYCFFIATSCSDEQYDLNIGEVQLKSNDYRNDDNISPIETNVAGNPTTISAMEIRTIWHAIVINAENNFTYADKEHKIKNIYTNPIEAELSFQNELAESFALMKQEYNDSSQSILQELARAKVYAYAKYLWCAQSNEFVNMKFKAEIPVAFP